MSVWFITGSSRGFGLEIARAALTAGHQVVATARKAETVPEQLPGAGDQLLAVPLDVTDPESIQALDLADRLAVLVLLVVVGG